MPDIARIVQIVPALQHQRDDLGKVLQNPLPLGPGRQAALQPIGCLLHIGRGSRQGSTSPRQACAGRDAPSTDRSSDGRHREPVPDRTRMQSADVPRTFRNL